MSSGVCALWEFHKDSLTPSPTDTSPATMETLDLSLPVYLMVMGMVGQISMEEGTPLAIMEGLLVAMEDI